MNNKSRLALLILVVLIALMAIFALAGAAVRNEDGTLAYLPVIMLITGTPQPTNTPGPSTATATPQPTLTPTPTATSIPSHFDNCAFRTGNNATVAVPVNVTINGGLVLAVGDEIAIFTPDGSICAGMGFWDGTNIAIAAWGDDSQTEEIDGLLDGQKMAYRIWDVSENSEILVSDAAYSLGNGLYAVDGIYAVSVFTLE